MNIIFQMLWILTFIYYIYEIGNIEKGKGKVVVLFLISCSVVFLGKIISLEILSLPIITIIFMLYDLFYDDEIFQSQIRKIIPYGIIISLGELSIILTNIVDEFMITEILCLVLYFFLSYKRGYLKLINGTIVSVIYLCILSLGLLINIQGYDFNMVNKSTYILELAIFFFSVLIFLMLEITLVGYQNGFEKNTKDFQQAVLKHQYEEIKNIYLDMRGWRHDYHNHLQVMKAHLAMGQMTELSYYLDKLEEDLDRVDTFVKSGNIMIDAILNSKLSLAEKAGIEINCSADVANDITISDIDLCAILGNLLDNAVEACEKIKSENRFIRVYIAIIKKQLYISIQNSAKEELDFNERNYISSKRGNHGLGMKRVKILTDKYDGFLNLQNEPGIFAAEVTLPLM